MENDLIIKYLDEPYSLLIDVLSIDEILTFIDMVEGRQIRFPKYRDTIDRTYFKDTFEEFKRVFGNTKAIWIYRQFSSLMPYFPVKKNALKNYRKSRVIKEFNGYNHSELALKYGYSVRNIYRIIENEKRSETSNE